MAYEHVNAAWPAGTNDGRDLKPTPQEAVSAAKRLYRFAMKRPFKGKVKLTSGNRYTWIRSGVLSVNPDWRNGGWHELVHLMSHYCASRLYPNAKGHGTQHHFLEKEMIEYVVKSGWLDGKLKRETKAKEKPDPVALRAERVLKRIEAWERKRRRAETALRKLKRQQRYYEARA